MSYVGPGQRRRTSRQNRKNTTRPTMTGAARLSTGSPAVLSRSIASFSTGRRSGVGAGDGRAAGVGVPTVAAATAAAGDGSAAAGAVAADAVAAGAGSAAAAASVDESVASPLPSVSARQSAN